MEFLPVDSKLTVAEIEHFISWHKDGNLFAHRHRYIKNFIDHFQLLINARQVLTYREAGALFGFCSWVLVDSARKKEINKSDWTLPSNVSSGDLLYVDVCLLSKRASIYRIKEYLEKNVRPYVRQVYWYNMKQRKHFSVSGKGEKLCKTTAD